MPHDNNLHGAEHLLPKTLSRLRGEDPLTPDGGCVLDFWQWAFSDLRSNVIRGVLAEYLVARALGADLTAPRVSWDNYDFKSPHGWKVEVKSSAYLQSWKQRRLSSISFSRLRGRTWDDDAVAYVGSAVVRADLFVFAAHTCSTPETYDVLDLAQWRFYPVAGLVVSDWNTDTVRLRQVEAVTTAVKWDGLATAAEGVMRAHRAVEF